MLLVANSLTYNVLLDKQNKSEAKVADLSGTLLQMESEVKIEREKLSYMKSEKDDVENSKLTSEYKVI